MPRPRKFDTDEAIGQFTELFWANGFGAVSIKDIAEKTGLRPGSLHAAFGNKDEMFSIAFTRYGQNFRDHMNIDSKGLAGAEAYLAQLARSALSDTDRKGCLIINTARELDVHTQAIRDDTFKRLEEMKAFFRERLAEDGIVSGRHCNALFGAAVAVLTLARAHQPEPVLSDIVSAAVGSVRAEIST